MLRRKQIVIEEVLLHCSEWGKKTMLSSREIIFRQGEFNEDGVYYIVVNGKEKKEKKKATSSSREVMF